MAISLPHSLSDCVKLLLTSGASADVSDENGFTPLHFAAAFGHHRLVHNAHNPYSLHQPVSKNSHCYILQPLNIWFHIEPLPVTVGSVSGMRTNWQILCLHMCHTQQTVKSCAKRVTCHCVTVHVKYSILSNIVSSAFGWTWRLRVKVDLGSAYLPRIHKGKCTFQLHMWLMVRFYVLL